MIILSETVKVCIFYISFVIYHHFLFPVNLYWALHVITEAVTDGEEALPG